MERQQAIEEVIRLKKEYDRNGDANRNNQNAQIANQIRSQYGLDDKLYGANVSLADAYSNYYKEFKGGSSNNQPQVQYQQPQQANNNFNQQGSFQNFQDMLMQNSTSYFESQKAQFDKMLNDQLTQLEMAYGEAVNQGKLSVNEAMQQFEQQKKQLEATAYQQAESTKLYGNEMGLANSQQMVGLQQGDNARFNSLHNENANIRDKRVNDIRDRINLITKQKDLDVARANAEHGYNIAGASAQSQQMYTQQMADFMGKDYFTQMGMQHDINMQDRQFSQRTKEMALQQGYDLEKMSIGQIYQQANMKYQNELDISKMFTGHKLDLEKMDKELSNTLVKMEKQFGFDSSLQGQAHRNAMAQMSASIKAQAKQADAEYEKAKQRQALSLGLSANATEYQIAQEAKRQNREDGLQSARDKRDAIIADSWATGFAQYEINSIFNNPDSLLNPKQPKDYRKDGYFLDIPGNVINKLTGYDKKNKKAIEEEAKKKAALDAIEKKKREILGGESVQDKFNRISE